MKCPICSNSDLIRLDSLASCRECDHVFADPPQISVSYDRDYVRRYDQYPTVEMSYLRIGFLKAFIASGRLVDIGYGNGAFVRAALAGKFDAWGHDIHGVDVGIPVVDPFSDPSEWSVVSFFDSLEHFPDFEAVKSLISRAKIVMVSVPRRPSWFPENLSWRHFKPGEHLHYFSLRSLSRLVDKPLLAASNVEDCIRISDHSEPNILTAVYGVSGN